MRTKSASLPAGLAFGILSCAVLGDPPAPDHIVIVIEENKGYEEIIGSIQAPYLNALAHGGATFTHMHALTHPSQPNYLHLFSGWHQGVFDNINPAPGTPFTTPNLAAALLAAGKTFSGYSEDLPGLGAEDPDTWPYARRHNPWVNWQADPPGLNQLPPSLNKPFFTEGPNPLPFYGDVNAPSDYSGLPLLSIVVPNLLNGMHDGSIKEADFWLESYIQPYRDWAETHNSLLIITWDEDSNVSRNRIATIFSGPMVRPGLYTGWWTIHDLLRTVEDLCGVSHSGLAARARPMAGWQQGGPVVTTLEFRQGVDGYSGAHDTYLDEAAPNTPRGWSILHVVNSFPTAQMLIRFDNIVGGTASQIPAGATVHAAKLVLVTGRNSLLSDESDSTHFAHCMMTDWSESTTWNSAVDGISMDDVEAKTNSEFEVVPNVLGAWAIFDVTESIQAVVNGTAANQGWMLRQDGMDAWRAYSSEAVSIEDRPLLIVTFDTSTCQAAIGTQPSNLRGDAGGYAFFSVGASGADPISYQWRRDGEPLSDGGSISGAATALLEIFPVSATDAGLYDVVVGNPCGTTISAQAELIVCLSAPTGDMNGDLRVDGLDVAFFSGAVVDGATDLTRLCMADFSQNGIVDASDIDRFIGIILSAER